MEVRQHRRKSISLHQESDSQNPYGKRLSFYELPPFGDISLEEFETFALDRLRVLKEIEALESRGVQSTSKEFGPKIDPLLNDYLSLPSEQDVRKGNMKEHEEKIRKDVISHFALRLAYCRPNDRRWFVDMERHLLSYRLRGSTTYLETFLHENGFYFPEVQQAEYLALSDQLKQLRASLSNIALDAGDAKYYKVKFQDALDVVQHRRALLKEGYAYVDKNDLISLVLLEYRSHLNRCLAVTFKHFAELKQDDSRITDLVEKLPSLYLSSRNYVSDNTSVVDVEDLDDLALRSYPLCMQNMHTALRSRHHLKHFGLLSYNLFLKTIGVSLDAVLEFWKDELERKGGRNFDKNYAYQIKHAYGTVGKRTSYTAYSCQKIIDEPQVEGGVHGCPFKLDRGNLRTLLGAKGVSQSDMNDILKVANEGQYQVACKCLFAAQHPNRNNDDIEAINHPNRYFDLSTKYYREMEEMKKLLEESKNSKQEST